MTSVEAGGGCQILRMSTSWRPIWTPEGPGSNICWPWSNATLNCCKMQLKSELFWQVLYLIVFVCAQRSKNPSNCNGKPQNDAFKKKHPRARKICQIIMPSCKTKRFHKLFGLPLLNPFFTNEIVLTRNAITKNKQQTKQTSFIFIHGRNSWKLRICFLWKHVVSSSNMTINPRIC